jgi:acyl carrier protein
LSQNDVDRAKIEKKILEIIVKEGLIDPTKLTKDATFQSLEIQSVDVLMILMALEEEFNFYIPVNENLTKVKDLKGLVTTLTDRVIAERTSRAK